MSPEDSDEGGDEKFKTVTRGIGAMGQLTAAVSEAPTTPVLKIQNWWANFNSGGRGDVMTALYTTYIIIVIIILIELYCHFSHVHYAH